MFRIMKYLSKAEIDWQMLIAFVSIVGQIWFDLELPDYMSDITTLVETPGSAMADILDRRRQDAADLARLGLLRHHHRLYRGARGLRLRPAPTLRSNSVRSNPSARPK